MTTAQANPIPTTASPVVQLRAWLSIYNELAKARLSMLVVVTAMVGYAMASPAHMDWIGFFWMSIGTALASGSANAFNQVLERDRDARMDRTKDRPLPASRIGATHATAFATIAGILGLWLLVIGTNLLAAGLALVTIVLYVAVYTPMKPRSTMNTVVGAVVGAIPPMIGWVAACGTVDPGAWVLGAVLFVWQMPHFLALAWMYREDYERGGYRMLPAVDPTGRLTSAAVLLYGLALLPVTVAVALIGLTGWVYPIGAVLLGGWVVKLSLRMWRERDATAARKLFLASVLYLPLLMGLMVADRVAHPEPADPWSYATIDETAQ